MHLSRRGSERPAKWRPGISGIRSSEPSAHEGVRIFFGSDSTRQGFFAASTVIERFQADQNSNIRPFWNAQRSQVKELFREER
jgi:hypothetical protein